MHRAFLKCASVAFMAVGAAFLCGCSGAGSGASTLAKEVATVAVDRGAYDAFPALLTDGITWSLVGLDGRQAVSSTLTVRPSDVYGGRFVASGPGGCYVYDVARPSEPLNAQPFAALTDFRMGYAYGTRTGRPIMIVDGNGVVVNILPESVVSVEVPADAGNSVAYTLADGRRGQMTPEGAILYEGRDERVDVGTLSDGRMVATGVTEGCYTILNENGREVATGKRGHKALASVFSGGWLPVSDGAGGGYFVDRDGELALTAPVGYEPVLRDGRVVVLKGGKGYALYDVASGSFVLNDATSIVPLRPLGRELFLVEDRYDGATIVFGVDGKAAGTAEFDGGDVEPLVADLALVKEDVGDRRLLVNILTGERVNNLYYAQRGAVYPTKVTAPGYVAEDLVDKLTEGISTGGWTLGNYMYTGNTRLADALGIDSVGRTESGEAAETVYNDFYETGNHHRFVRRHIGDDEVDFVFDTAPVRAGTVTPASAFSFFGFSMPLMSLFDDTTYEWSDTARVAAMVRWTGVPEGTDVPTLVQNALRRLGDRGFVGYYERPDAASSEGMAVTVRYYPGPSGVYTVVAFGNAAAKSDMLKADAK